MNALSRREFARAGFLASLATLLPAQAWADGSPVVAPDTLRFVDPELRPLARQILSNPSGNTPLSNATLGAMRQMVSSFSRPILPDVPVRKVIIPGGPGNDAMAIYIVNARRDGSRGGVIHTHGGGFIAGTAASGLRDLQEMAQAVDCVIVSVDYRLSPETTFQGSIEDNYAALRWLHVHADELGVDRNRLAVMGESAGGGHAALLALAARDRQEISLVYQLLVYPMLDDRTGSSHSLPAPIGTIAWTAPSNRFGWQAFLGQEPGTRHVPDRAVPARTADLSGLPPTFIGVGSIDLFVDEDIEYARRLCLAGVSTELVVVPGAFHGFNIFAVDTRIAQTFNALKVNALRRAFSGS